MQRSSISTLDEEELPRLLYVYQLSASKLPHALQSLLPSLALFPSARWVSLLAQHARAMLLKEVLWQTFPFPPFP